LEYYTFALFLKWIYSYKRRHSFNDYKQWFIIICRKGQSGEAIELFQITPIRRWFPNTQQSRLLTAWGRLEKFVSPSIFDISLSSLMMMRNLQSYPTAVSKEIMWPFGGSKHTLTPPT